MNPWLPVATEPNRLPSSARLSTSTRAARHWGRSWTGSETTAKPDEPNFRGTSDWLQVSEPSREAATARTAGFAARPSASRGRWPRLRRPSAASRLRSFRPRRWGPIWKPRSSQRARAVLV